MDYEIGRMKGIRFIHGGRKMHDVTISEADNGWIVKVGCMTLVFNSKKKLLKELGKYLEDPGKMQRKYMRKYRGVGNLSAHPAVASIWRA